MGAACSTPAATQQDGPGVEQAKTVQDDAPLPVSEPAEGSEKVEPDAVPIATAEADTTGVVAETTAEADTTAKAEQETAGPAHAEEPSATDANPGSPSGVPDQSADGKPVVADGAAVEEPGSTTEPNQETQTATEAPAKSEKKPAKPKAKEKEKSKGATKAKEEAKNGSKSKTEVAMQPEPTSAAEFPKEFAGKFSHPVFGDKKMDISVTLSSATAGEWMVGKKRFPITVTTDGDVVSLKDGMTENRGKQDAKGNIKGEMFQEGVGGGKFSLTRIQKIETKVATDLKVATDFPAHFEGQFSHPVFGESEKTISVELHSATKGEWMVGKKRFPITVSSGADFITLSDGMTEYRGKPDTKGNIKGEMLQEGVGGGKFALKKVTAKASASEAKAA